LLTDSGKCRRRVQGNVEWTRMLSNCMLLRKHRCQDRPSDRFYSKTATLEIESTALSLYLILCKPGTIESDK